jgi:MFS transporter, NRE family, putaive nickel resistance protein
MYWLVLGLNIFNAFFTPTYQATIPLVMGETAYPQAIALSSTTYQILGVFGPGIAAVLALFIKARELFFWDGASFLIAAILIAALPRSLRVETPDADRSVLRILTDLRSGTTRLWTDAAIRYGLIIQLVAAIAGAQILVNTVGYVQGILQQSAAAYGWVMMGFGLGATAGTFALGTYPQFRSRITTLLGGGLLITLALLPANYIGLAPLILLWSIAGCGQSFINLSVQTLIADRTPTDLQGRVYGAHFAWSHLWWAGAYPLAGWLGSSFTGHTFLFGGVLGLMVLALTHFLLKPDRFAHTHANFWHTHEHHHDPHHHHEHSTAIDVDAAAHQHPHLHSEFSHVHPYIDLSHEHQR